jgi:hypothetical protein
MRDERTHVGRLIGLLDDPEVAVQRAAYAALKSLTNQDFGPALDASKAEKALAAMRAGFPKILSVKGRLKPLQAAATTWGSVSGEDRAKVLHRIGGRPLRESA